MLIHVSFANTVTSFNGLEFLHPLGVVIPLSDLPLLLHFLVSSPQVFTNIPRAPSQLEDIDIKFLDRHQAIKIIVN
jgi:hypothetical protein